MTGRDYFFRIDDFHEMTGWLYFLHLNDLQINGCDLHSAPP